MGDYVVVHHPHTHLQMYTDYWNIVGRVVRIWASHFGGADARHIAHCMTIGGTGVHGGLAIWSVPTRPRWRDPAHCLEGATPCLVLIRDHFLHIT